MVNNFQIAFISGANRGIGLELARQLSKQPYKIIAGYREINHSEQLLDEAKKNRAILPCKVDITVRK